MAVGCLGGCGGEDTEEADDGEDEGDYDGLDIGSTGLVGVSSEITDVQTERGVVSEHAVEVGEECPDEDGALHCGALGDDGAVVDGSTSSAKGVSEDGQEADRGDDALEGEEVLNLESPLDDTIGKVCR